MKAGLISFTRHGAVLAQRLSAGLALEKILCETWVKKKEITPPDGVQVLHGELKAWTREQFARQDAIIFISAAAIAVRSIAPYLKNKKDDPAVLVIDEQGRYVISLLSGHIGGANELALLVAKILGAEPVITTATDLHGRFAVDAFAAKKGMYLDSMLYAKEIAARLVEGARVGMRSAYPVEGNVPKELDMVGKYELGFTIDIRKGAPFSRTLHLVPRVLTLGIGCRKGIHETVVKEVVTEVLEEYGIYQESVRQIASIDLKKEEKGILALADSLGVPFVTYSATELLEVEAEEDFQESEFVRQVTGVGNVCERAALKGAGVRRLLIPKTACDGVTVAAAAMTYTVCMEETRWNQ